MTTTNGTRAIHRAAEAADIYMGALIDGRTVAQKRYDQGRDAVLLCAGTKGCFSLEDILTAGYIIYRLQRLTPEIELELDDLGMVSLDLY